MYSSKRKLWILLNINLLFTIYLVHAQPNSKKIEDPIDKATEFQYTNTDSVLFYSNMAFKKAIHLSNPEKQVEVLILMIKTETKIGKYANAISKCKLADSIIRTNNLNDKTAQILMLKGVVFQTIGLQSEAMDYLIKAEKLIESSHQTKLKTDLYYYFAVGFYKVNEIKKSREYADKAIASALQKEKPTSLINSYALISNLYNIPDSIYKYLQLAEEYSNKIDNSYIRITVLNNKGLLYDNIGKSDSAKITYKLAMSLADSNRYVEALANLKNNLAYIYMSEKKYDSAYLMLQQALSDARELKNIDLEASILDSFSDYYSEINDPEKSLKYYKESVHLKNKYEEKQQREKSLFLSTVFETEKKEKQLTLKQNELNRSRIAILTIALLLSVAVAVIIYFRQKLTNRKTRLLAMEKEKKLEVTNALIEGQDVERKRLAMDLHDGVNPRIGILKMAVENELKNSERLTNIIRSFDDIIQEVREMSHKMLPTQLESKGLVFAIDNFVKIINKNRDLDINFYSNLDIRLKPKLEINLFFIVYELINNALKHANATTIDIQLVKTQHEVMISVEDDGKGFDKNKEAGGHGLKNLRERVRFLEGTFEIESNIGEGTLISVEVSF